jgi:hypothetical protein
MTQAKQRKPVPHQPPMLLFEVSGPSQHRHRPVQVVKRQGRHSTVSATFQQRFSMFRCCYSVLHAIVLAPLFLKRKKKKKCSDGAPVRFFRAALSGVWDLSCSVSSLPAPILVLELS